MKAVVYVECPNKFIGFYDFMNESGWMTTGGYFTESVKEIDVPGDCGNIVFRFRDLVTQISANLQEAPKPEFHFKLIDGRIANA